MIKISTLTKRRTLSWGPPDLSWNDDVLCPAHPPFHLAAASSGLVSIYFLCTWLDNHPLSLGHDLPSVRVNFTIFSAVPYEVKLENPSFRFVYYLVVAGSGWQNCFWSVSIPWHPEWVLAHVRMQKPRIHVPDRARVKQDKAMETEVAGGVYQRTTRWTTKWFLFNNISSWLIDWVWTILQI